MGRKKRRQEGTKGGKQKGEESSGKGRTVQATKTNPLRSKTADAAPGDSKRVKNGNNDKKGKDEPIGTKEINIRPETYLRLDRMCTLFWIIVVLLPAGFFLLMLVTSDISPRAREYWHTHFWSHILPRPSPEAMDKNKWNKLMMDMLFEMPPKLPLIHTRVHANGKCCLFGTPLVLGTHELASFESLRGAIEAVVPSSAKEFGPLQLYTDFGTLANLDGLFHAQKSLLESGGDGVVNLVYVQHNALYVWSPQAVGHKFQPPNVVPAEPGERVGLETLSLSPLVFRVSNFLSDAEIDHFKAVATDRLKRSSVGIDNTGLSVDRTSRNAWDTSTNESLAVQRRGFALARLPFKKEMADGLQILRYLPGQTYVGHTDYFTGQYENDDPSKPGGSNRFLTIFCYLGDVEEGGATIFPKSRSHSPKNSAKAKAAENAKAKGPFQCTANKDESTECSNRQFERGCVGWRATGDCDPSGPRVPAMDLGCGRQIPKGQNISGYCECEGGRRVMQVNCEHTAFSCEAACGGKSDGDKEGDKADSFSWECGQGEGLAVYPKKGDAILFYSQTPDAQLDPQSFHGGCPIIQGTKWAANLWIWNAKRPKNNHLASRLNVVFKNTNPFPVDLYWISHSGEDQLFHTFAPDTTFRTTTYLDHKWIAKRQGTEDRVGEVILMSREKLEVAI
jgi:hypothetical protein|eukprot:g2270.t1